MGYLKGDLSQTRENFIFAPKARCRYPQRDICCFLKCSCILQPNYRMKKSIQPIFLLEISFSNARTYPSCKLKSSASHSTFKFSNNEKKYTDFYWLTWKFSPHWKRVSLGFNHIWSKTLSFLPDNLRPSLVLCPLNCSLIVVACEKKNHPSFKLCAQFFPVEFRHIFLELTFAVFFETRAECGLKVGDVLDRFFDNFDLKDARKIDLPFGIFLRLTHRESVACSIIPYLRHTRPRGCRRNQWSKSGILQRFHLFLVGSDAFSNFPTSWVLELFFATVLVAKHFLELQRARARNKQIWISFTGEPKSLKSVPQACV